MRADKISGVYQIKNIINGHLYVGSSVNVHKRWGEHKSGLNNKKHHNPHLQSAWDCYGSDVFKFMILEDVGAPNTVMLFEAEQWWHGALNPDYNIRDIAESNLGLRHTEETKRKIGIGNTGKIKTEETKKKISISHKGKHVGEKNHFYGKYHTEEAKQKMSEANTGRVLSDETKRKLSIRHKGLQAGEKHPMWGKHLSKETCQKISEANLGIKRSKETLRIMSEVKSGEKNPQARLTWDQVREIRAKYSQGYLQRILAEEYNVAQSAISNIINNKAWKEK